MNLFKRLFSGGASAPHTYNILDITDDEFPVQVLRRSYKQPVMVDFWAEWCAPCRMLGPILEKIATDQESDVMLIKLNIEENPRMPAQYRVSSIPAVKLFRNGQVAGEFTGVMPEANIRAFLEKIKAAPPPAPKIKIPPKPVARLNQAARHLKKGRGFEASVLLADFPNSPQQAQAERLFPFAAFLRDLEDGDWVSGSGEADQLFDQAAARWKQRDKSGAMQALQTAQELDESGAIAGKIEAILDAIEALQDKN